MDLPDGDKVSPLRCAESNCSPLRVLRALHATAEVLATGSGQEEMLLKILQTLETEVGMTRGTVMLVSPDGSELQLAAATGVAHGERGKLRYRAGEGITGEVLRTGKSIIVPRISAEPRFQGRIHSRDQSEKTRLSFICVPVVVGSQVVGSLAVDLACRDLAELEEQEQLLAIVAGMIAHDVKARRIAQLRRKVLESENLKLRDALEENIRPANMVGNSTAAREVYRRINQVAGANTTCLIRGESGTGKELVATAIHFLSAPGWPVHQGKLRRTVRHPAGKRALRPRARGVQWSGELTNRPVRGGEWRNAVPR